MKAADLKKEWLQILILALPFCAVALLWDRIPGWVPTHWNARGEVDGMARKAYGVLALPCVNVGLAFLMTVLPLIDPKMRKQEGDTRNSLWRTVRIIRLGTTTFMAFMSVAALAAALNMFKDGAQFSRLLNFGVAFLFILLGNFMSKIRPNYFLGIRTPWTLESKEVWTKTHRMGGRLFVVAGFIMVVASLTVPLEQYVYCVLLPLIVGVSLFTTGYSYVIYKKENRTAAVS